MGWGPFPLKHIGFRREGVGTQLGTVGRSAELKGVGWQLHTEGQLWREEQRRKKRVWVELWGTQILKGVKGTRSQGEAERLTREGGGERAVCIPGGTSSRGRKGWTGVTRWMDILSVHCS